VAMEGMPLPPTVAESEGDASDLPESQDYRWTAE